jgi:hypothetical protein
LPTPSLEQLCFALDEAVATGEILAVYGEAGVGKTEGTRHALAAHAGIETVKVTAGERASTKDLASMLTAGLNAGDNKATLFRLRQRLSTELSRKRRIVVVDEAQLLAYHSFELLRLLHDEVWERHLLGDGELFTLVLVGGHGCYETLMRYPMLESRVGAWVEFAPLSEEQVCELMPGYHPIYRDADAELLLLVNDHCRRGNLRDWANFTLKATHLCRRTGSEVITEQIVRNVIGWHRGRRASASAPKRKRVLHG